MKHNLFVNYYTDRNAVRQDELNFCVIENLKNKILKSYYMICSKEDYNSFINYLAQKGIIKKQGNFIIDREKILDKIIHVDEVSRPTFNNYFDIISYYANTKDYINIVANCDIIIPEKTLLDCISYVQPDVCLALTRYDIQEILNYQNNSVFLDRWDSQDVWIFNGMIPKIVGADFTLGVAGTDNKIAYLLEQSGYKVLNPSRTLVTYHYHLSQVLNYVNPVTQYIERLQPPFKLIDPTY